MNHILYVQNVLKDYRVSERNYISESWNKNIQSLKRTSKLCACIGRFSEEPINCGSTYVIDSFGIGVVIPGLVIVRDFGLVGCVVGDKKELGRSRRNVGPRVLDKKLSVRTHSVSDGSGRLRHEIFRLLFLDEFLLFAQNDTPMFFRPFLPARYENHWFIAFFYCFACTSVPRY